MLTVSKLIAAGAGLAPVLVRRAATVELDWDTRQKSRFDALDSHGRRIGVFLARGQVVRGGDVLVAEDGSLIAVMAQAQPVLKVTAGPRGSALDLLRAAYHLGNRHVPLEVKGDHLQFEPDHVLVEMLRRMGLVVEPADAAFEPEGGAYDATTAVHGHGHGHAHAEPAPHDHDQGHVHDAHCGHDHGSHGHGSPDHGSHDHGDHDHGSHGHRDSDHAVHDQGARRRGSGSA